MKVMKLKKPMAKKIFSAFMIAIMTISLIGGAYVADIHADTVNAELNAPITRVSGANRYSTSIEVAKALKAELNVSKFKAVIIALTSFLS